MAARPWALAAGILVLAAALWAPGGAGAAALSPAPADPHAWPVYHQNAAGTGVAPSVTAVNTRSRAWTSPALDGNIYGEPLVYARRVYVATQNDTVYALSSATGRIAWSRHLGRPVPAGSLPCGNIAPTVGITGTPVIDQSRGEIFVVADELVRGRPAHVLAGLATASGRVEMTRNVDPAGADPASLLQRTGLTLDAGRVVFGMGGNFGDCGSYRGRVEAVPETGGRPAVFTVDAAARESQGAVWMGGAAPVVDRQGHVWVTVGNGSATSSSQAYDHSDSVLELSSTMRLLQFYAPSNWRANNAQDLDMSTAPAVLSDGQVIAAAKSGSVYLLNSAHLGGIGRQEAILGSACSIDIDGGFALAGTTVYLPCLTGVIAVRAARSPASLRLLWSAGNGGGPPIIAAGLVWTIIVPNGILLGLNPADGKVRQQAAIGAEANHFPTPSVGDGLLLAPSARRVVAFRATSSRAATPVTPVTAPTSPAGQSAPTGGGGISPGAIAGSVLGGVVVVGGGGWLLWRRRKARQGRVQLVERSARRALS
jgi:outer membrane protein assembly factor BamB